MFNRNEKKKFKRLSTSEVEEEQQEKNVMH